MAATAYYTDAFRNGTFPDATVPAGTVLAQFCQYTAHTTTYAEDTVYLFRLPKNAVLVDLIVQFDTGGSSGTLKIGTCVANSTTGLWNSPTVVAADNIVNAAAISNTGAGRLSLTGGFVSTNLLSSAMLGTGTAITLGKKFSVETGIYATFATTAFPNDADLYVTVLYFMDYGADMAYDAADA